MQPTLKLGKRNPVKKLSLKFSDFILLTPDSPLVDIAPSYAFPMDLNDQYGTCVVAAFDHARQTITGLLTGTQQNLTTAQIESFYQTQNPDFPAEDNGMDMQTFLEYLTENKYILGFAKIDYTNEAEMKAATYMGLSIMCGVQLQQAQETQFLSLETWDTVLGSPIIGGHGVNTVGYETSPDNTIFVSWGSSISATQGFINNQMDEAWFILMQEHVDHPSFKTHWDLNAFAQAVSEITEGKIIIPTINAN